MPYSKEKRRLYDQKRNHRGIWLWKKYRITREKYDEMLASQGGVCAICKGVNATGRPLSVDHCHTTRMNRALLCQPCNLGIGHLKESTATLYRAIEYLNAYSN